MENYVTFRIPKKSGGFREISAPVPELKLKQREILDKLYQSKILEHISPYAYGFIPGRSIYSNAQVHAGKKFLVNIDIKDFFPNCHKSKLDSKSILRKLLNDEELGFLFHKDALPQGAPTSPLVSNIFLADFDSVLPTVLRRTISDDIRYSRYADDITISSNSKAIFSKTCMKIISDVLTHYGFEINHKKTRYMSPSSRQEVTGLVLNSGKPTVSRKFRRNLRAAVHNIVSGKVIPSEKELNRIKGHLSFCMQVPEHREWAAQLLSQLGVRVNPEYVPKDRKIEDNFKKTIEAYAKGKISKLPFSIDNLSLAKIIFRSKNLPVKVRLSHSYTLVYYAYDWLLDFVSRDLKFAERFIEYIMEQSRHFTENQLKGILREIFPKLSTSKRVSLIIAYPEIQKYVRRGK